MEFIKPENRTAAALKKIKNVDVANKQLYGKVAARNDISPGQVEELIKFVGTYTRGVMEQGAYETVMIPLFGKIKPKVKKIQWMHHAQTRPKILKAIPPDEPVHNK